MSKIKKTDLLQLVQEQAEMIAELSAMVELNKMSIIKLENEREKPQLKQLEVDLSSELTGSELCKAMLARGDTRIMCIVSDEGTRQDLTHVIRAYSDGKFHTKANRWSYAVPINNQGEPLTASEVGL